jgi:hypothetical protein
MVEPGTTVTVSFEPPSIRMLKRYELEIICIYLQMIGKPPVQARSPGGMGMILRELLKGIEVLHVQKALWTSISSDIHYDSRQVTPGSLFFCIEGFRADGHDFAADQQQKKERQAVLLRKGCILAAQTELPRYLWRHPGKPWAAYQLLFMEIPLRI